MDMENFYILQGGKDIDGKWYLGRARLVFIYEFTHYKRLNRDYNYKIDATRIRTSLEKLHFKVDKEILNPTKEQLIGHFEDRTNYFGCAILFIFSHGKNGYFLCSDYSEKNGKVDGRINMCDVYNYFTITQKPDMRDCPKIFFNQFCQTFDANIIYQSDFPSLDQKCRDTADWLIYDAAVPGYKTYFSKTKGSYSISIFCDLLDKMANAKELRKILDSLIIKVSETIVKDNKESHFMHPIQHSTLQKDLYLLPEHDVYKLISVYRKEFQHKNVLGSGKFATVLKAVKNVDEGEYAIKRIQLNNKETNLSKVKNEVDSLRKLGKCEFIVQYYDVWYETPKWIWQSRQDHHLNITGLQRTDAIIHLCYIQMELCGESLEQWLKSKSDRDKVDSLKIFEQILRGLAFIHGNNLIHRDIKPGNILFAISDRTIRIADFGLARHADSFTTTGNKGTLLYAAPEMLRGKYDTKFDMYSAGLVLIELLYNCTDKILNKAKDEGIRNAERFPEPFTNGELQFAVNSLEKLLSSDSNNRPSSEDLLKTVHVWLNNVEPEDASVLNSVRDLNLCESSVGKSLENNILNKSEESCSLTRSPPVQQLSNSVDQRQVLQFRDTELEDRVLKYFRDNQGEIKPIDVAHDLNVDKKLVNKTLYGLQKKGLLIKTSESPPVWQLSNSAASSISQR